MGLACEDGMGGSQARQSVRQLTGAGKGMRGKGGRFVRGLEHWDIPLLYPVAGEGGEEVLPEWKERKRKVLWVNDLGV